MKDLIELFKQHPAFFVGVITATATWVFNNIFTAAVASMPAPTKDSTAKYIFWFQFLNKLVGNYLRAHASNIENSPNFKDAVEKYIAAKSLNAGASSPESSANTQPPKSDQSG